MQKNKKVAGIEYRIKKQLHGLFKVTEYKVTDMGVRKRTIAKNLNLSDAEGFLYKIEKK